MSASGTTTRLSANDWVRAAFEIMIDEGISGVKITRLCERLGVTKGSFYWHFTDVDAFHGELARRWAEDAVRTPRALDVDAAATPEVVMLSAMALFSDRRNRNLTRAVREWAQNDERARDAIRAADEALFGRIKKAMLKLGFDDDDAEVRAKLLYYSGVGFASVGSLGKKAGTEQLAATLEIFTRR